MTQQHATLELIIRGMDCSNWAGHLESVIKEIAGVAKVTTLLTDHKAIVLFHPAKTTPTAIRESIEAAGYVIVAEGDDKTVETESAKQPMQPAGVKVVVASVETMRR